MGSILGEAHVSRWTAEMIKNEMCNDEEIDKVKLGKHTKTIYLKFRTLQTEVGGRG